MYGLSRPSYADAMVLIVGACGALVLQGCGELVSSDCAERALCPPAVDTTMGIASAPRPDGDVATSEPHNQAAKDNADGRSSDAAWEEGARATAVDGRMDGGLDSAKNGGAPDSSLDVANIDVADETGNDASTDSGIASGPRCFATDGGFEDCNAAEHCCVNAMTRVANCSSSCDSTAGLYAVDCAGASGDRGCGAQICCGSIVLSGGTVPDCTASMLTSACVDSCSGDRRVPGSTGMCLGRYSIRLCAAAADCAGNPNGNTACCNFGNPPSPVNWCVAPLSNVSNYANSCL
jgi:hypothetical protein